MDEKKTITLRVKPLVMAQQGEIKLGMPDGGKGNLVCKTVRIPTRYLAKIEKVAAERQVSFNQVVLGIIETCLRAAEAGAGEAGAEKE